jgi:benzoyl-CoA reductase/2-hydroxyglutaryl-CoA dehydratase subunit BcrC/BadD/HgdB
MDRTREWDNLLALLKKSKRSPSSFSTLAATKKRAALSAKLLRKAYSDAQTVVWKTAFVPSEIVYALDMVPFPVESVIAMFSHAHVTEDALAAAEENDYSRDVCSFLRGTVGASLLGYLPTPDFLISTSLYCEGSSSVFHSLGNYFEKESFYIDIPYRFDAPGSQQYVADQLEHITLEMARRSGRPFKPERLAQAIEYSNAAANYFKKAFDLRRHVPSPMLGGEAIDYVASFAHTWGCPETVDIYKTLYEELQQRVDRGEGATEKEEFRIQWRQLRPYYTEWPFEYLELKNHAVVVGEEANYVHWSDMDPSRPFLSLADKLLSTPPLGPFQRWLDASVQGSIDYKIDGVVEFAQWGCRHLNSGTQFLHEELQKLGIPLLVLDGDCVDQREFSEGQVRTRIDAFLEMLRAKKRERN